MVMLCPRIRICAVNDFRLVLADRSHHFYAHLLTLVFVAIQQSCRSLNMIPTDMKNGIVHPILIDLNIEAVWLLQSLDLSPA